MSPDCDRPLIEFIFTAKFDARSWFDDPLSLFRQTSHELVGDSSPIFGLPRSAAARRRVAVRWGGLDLAIWHLRRRNQRRGRPLNYPCSRLPSKVIHRPRRSSSVASPARRRSPCSSSRHGSGSAACCRRSSTCSQTWNQRQCAEWSWGRRTLYRSSVPPLPPLSSLSSPFSSFLTGGRIQPPGYSCAQ